MDSPEFLDQQRNVLQNQRQHAIQQAKGCARYAKDHGVPVAMEVVQTARPNVDGEIFSVQPAGMHKLFKTHKLVHTEPIPS